MTTSTEVDIGTLIYSEPELHGGRACLAGTGMTVHGIVAHHIYHGESPEEILEAFPDLGLARIHAALAHYFANQALIDAELDEDERLHESLRSDPARQRFTSRPA